MTLLLRWTFHITFYWCLLWKNCFWFFFRHVLCRMCHLCWHYLCHVAGDRGLPNPDVLDMHCCMFFETSFIHALVVLPSVVKCFWKQVNSLLTFLYHRFWYVLGEKCHFRWSFFDTIRDVFSQYVQDSLDIDWYVRSVDSFFTDWCHIYLRCIYVSSFRATSQHLKAG